MQDDLRAWVLFSQAKICAACEKSAPNRGYDVVARFVKRLRGTCTEPPAGAYAALLVGPE